jgi:hypothetical protein
MNGKWKGVSQAVKMSENVSWVYLAQVRDPQWAPAKTVIKLLVSQNSVNFSTGWASTSFSRRALFHGVRSLKFIGQQNSLTLSYPVPTAIKCTTQDSEYVVKFTQSRSLASSVLKKILISKNDEVHPLASLK